MVDVAVTGSAAARRRGGAALRLAGGAAVRRYGRRAMRDPDQWVVVGLDNGGTTINAMSGMFSTTDAQIFQRRSGLNRPSLPPSSNSSKIA